MKVVSARDANHGLSALLSEVEEGEEVVITRRGRPVAVLRRYEPPKLTPERLAAIERAEAEMEAGLPWGDRFRIFSRDEMHQR